MDAKFILIIAAVGLACFLLGLLAGSRRGARDGRMIVQRPTPRRAPSARSAPRPAASICNWGATLSS